MAVRLPLERDFHGVQNELGIRNDVVNNLIESGRILLMS